MNNVIRFINPNTDKVTEETLVKYLAQAAINKLKRDKHNQKSAS